MSGASNARKAAVGQIEDAPASIRASVVNRHDNSLAIVTILHLHFGAHGKRGVGSREAISIEASTTGGGLAVIAVANAIVTGLAARQYSRLGRGAAKQQEGN